MLEKQNKIIIIDNILGQQKTVITLVDAFIEKVEKINKKENKWN